MASQHSSPIASLVLITHTERNKTARIALDVVFPALLQFPSITLGQLLVACVFELGRYGIDKVEDGWVVCERFTEGLGVRGGILGEAVRSIAWFRDALLL